MSVPSTPASPSPLRSLPVDGPSSTALLLLSDIDPGAAAAHHVMLRWHVDGHVVVVLSGEIDCASAPRLDVVRTLIASSGGRVAVDASGVTFVDVTGLRSVLGAVGDGPLLLLAPSSAVLRLLGPLSTLGAVTTSTPPAGDPAVPPLDGTAGPPPQVVLVDGSRLMGREPTPLLRATPTSPTP